MYEEYAEQFKTYRSVRLFMNVVAIGSATIGGCAKILPQLQRAPDETTLLLCSVASIYLAEYFRKYEGDSHAMSQKLRADLDTFLRYHLSLRDQAVFDDHHIAIDVRTHPYDPYVQNNISESDTLPQQPSVVRCVRTVSKYAAETVAFLSHLLS